VLCYTAFKEGSEMKKTRSNSKSKNTQSRAKTAPKVQTHKQMAADITPAANQLVIGQFADGRVAVQPREASPVRKWWRGLSRTWRVLATVGAAVLGSATFYVTAAQAYEFYWSGYSKADEVTREFNSVTDDERSRLFRALAPLRPLMDSIDAANADRNENAAYYMTVAYKQAAAKYIKADPWLDYDAETFFGDLTTAAYCAKDGCDRDALIANMGVAFCRADRKLGGWLADFRAKKTKAKFAQPYVDFLATLPCDSILYRSAIS